MSEARQARREEDRRIKNAIDKSIKSGKQMVETVQLTEEQAVTLRSMELAIRDMKTAQGSYLANIAVWFNGYAEGVQLAFDIDWKSNKVRMTMVPPKAEESLESSGSIDT